MKTDDHNHISGLLEELFLEESLSSSEDARALHDALAAMPEDAPHRRAYDQLAIASRALEQGETPSLTTMSAMELAMQEQVFSSALDDLLAAESHSTPQENEETKQAQIIDIKSFFKKNQTPLAASMAAILVASLGAALLLDRPTSQPDEFVARGSDRGVALRVADASARQEFEAFCITRTDNAPHISSSKDAPFGLFSCPSDGELQFAYSTAALPSVKLRHLSVFGISARGKLLWYGPSPAAHDPYFLRDAAKPVPLPQAIALKVNHAPNDPVRVYALFSQSPLPHANMERLLTGQDRSALFASPEQFATLLEQSPEAQRAGLLHAVTLKFDVTEVTQP